VADFQPDFVVCEECDAVHRWRHLHSDEVAHCTRCGVVLGRGHRLDAQSLLALSVTALIVFLIANLSSIVSVGLRGRHADTTLAGAASIAWQQGEHVVAALAVATAIVAPAALIVLRLLVLWPLARGRGSAWVALGMRIIHAVSVWNMVEVLTVAALVSIVRISHLANADAGPGVLAFATLALIFAALESAGLRHLWWSP